MCLFGNYYLCHLIVVLGSGQRGPGSLYRSSSRRVQGQWNEDGRGPHFGVSVLRIAASGGGGATDIAVPCVDVSIQQTAIVFVVLQTSQIRIIYYLTYRQALLRSTGSSSTSSMIEYKYDRFMVVVLVPIAILRRVVLPQRSSYYYYYSLYYYCIIPLLYCCCLLYEVVDRGTPCCWT